MRRFAAWLLTKMVRFFLGYPVRRGPVLGRRRHQPSLGVEVLEARAALGDMLGVAIAVAGLTPPPEPLQGIEQGLGAVAHFSPPERGRVAADTLYASSDSQAGSSSPAIASPLQEGYTISLSPRAPAISAAPATPTIVTPGSDSLTNDPLARMMGFANLPTGTAPGSQNGTSPGQGTEPPNNRYAGAAGGRGSAQAPNVAVNPTPGTTGTPQGGSTGGGGGGGGGGSEQSQAMEGGPGGAGAGAAPAVTPPATPSSHATPAAPAAALPPAAANGHAQGHGPHGHKDGLTPGDPPVSATEGVSFSGPVATFTDSDGNTNPQLYTASINWGDSTGPSTGTVSYASGVFTIGGTHTYAEEGNYAISVTINDSDGSQTTASSSASVADAPLSASGLNASALAGTSFTAPLANFTDADPGDSSSTYNVSINWGDNSSPSTGLVGGSNGSFTAGGTHTYASAGVYHALITITDPGGSSTTTQSQITVSPPSGPGSLTITPAIPPSLTEGTPFNGTVATFTDSDTTQLAGAYSATITWGDSGSSTGTITGGSGTFTITAAHTYADEGSDSVTINVADTDGAHSQAGMMVTVAEGDHLTAAGVNVNATEGTAFNGPVATFTDTDTTTLSGDFTTTINWGDGNFSAGTVSGGSGTFTINGAHTYADEGSYTIQVGVGDDGTGSATAATNDTATVAEGDVLTPHGLTTTASVNAAFSGAVATFTDTDTTNPATDFTAQINWGDGTITGGSVSGSGGSFTVSGTHTYTTAATFPVSVTLSDDSPGTATASASSTITVGYADTLAVTATALTVTEGTAFNGQVATFTDSNTSLGSGAFTATITWGDGSGSTTGTVSGGSGDFTVTANHTYGDEGSFPVQVTVNESLAAPASSTATATVADADLLTPQPVPTVSATEGVSFAGTVASFSDAFKSNSSSDLTATINWGDGSSTTTGTVSGGGSSAYVVGGSHTYAEEGSYQIQVTLQDPGGSSNIATTTAFVTDAALAGSGTTLTGNLGQAVNGVVVNFTDADPSGTVGDYSAVIAWGDGQYSQGTIGQGSTSFTVSGTHAYAQAGAHTATVTIYDQGGAQVVVTTAITVLASSGSGKLTATGSTVQVTEGQSTNGVVVATFADSDGNSSPGLYTATVHWGDGSSETATVTTAPGGGFEVVGATSHAYTEEGSYPVYVTIQDSDGDAAFASSTVSVADASLTVTASAISPTAGIPFVGSVATFTDADPQGTPSDYTATINWGDGSIVTGGGIISQAGQLEVEGGHIYAQAGSYTITVTVNDIGGATGSSTAALTVTAPAQTLTGTAITATEATAFSGTVAVFTPANPNAPASDFQATVAWGDGSQSTATLTSDGNGHLIVSGSHTWSDEAPAGTAYGVTVTVVSAQNPTQSPLTETTIITVADAALTAAGSSFMAWAAQPSGQVLVGTFTDANPQSSTSDFTAKITWGDGVGSSQGVVEANGSGGYNVYGAYTYQTAGSYTVTVNITDDGGSSATTTTTATVNTPAASLSATEGAAFSGTVASFNGQDTTQLTGSATITWGDGNQSAGTITSTGPSSFTVSGSHTYLEEGLEPLMVTVGRTGTGGNLVGQGMGVVQDAALTATGTNVTATVNEATGLVQVADFTDTDPSGTLSDYTASVNWGDGQVTTGQIQADGHGGFEVLGNHTYLFSGSFTISTTIQDAGGSNTVASSLAQAPSPSATGIAALEGTDFEYTRSLTINLPSGQSPPSSFTATIAWGDGTSSQGVVVDTGLSGSTLTATVTADHIYSEDGLYTLTTTVSGSDGNNYSPAAQTIDVADAPLTAGVVSLTAVATSTPPAPVQVADFYDGNLYGAAGDFTATIDWGDGSATTTGTVQALGNGHFAVLGGHTFASAGTDTVTVNVTEDGGSSVQITGAVTVQAPWTVIAATSGTRGNDPSQACLLTYGEATVDINQGALRLSQQLDFDQNPGTDVGRNPSLVYNSATVDVQPVVQIGLTGVQGTVPTQIAVQLTWNGVQQSTVYFTPTGSQQSYLLSVPVQGPVTQSGAYNWSATITVTLPGSQTAQTSTSGVAYVVARDSSPYGAGWGIDGIDQLVVGSTGALFVTGQGDSRFFASNGNGTFTGPPEDFGTLVQNQDGTYTYTAHDQSKENFSAQGLMTSFVDRDNLTTTYQYDGDGRLLQVNSIDGGVTTLGYTGGLLSSIAEPGNRTLSFGHDGSGNLTTITDAVGNGRTLSYDSAHHVTRDQWSPLDASFTYNSSNGQLTDVNLGLGTAYTIVSAASGASVSASGQAQATVTDGRGGTSTYVLDLRGRLLQETDPMTYVTTYQLDQAGEVLQVTDPMGRVTKYLYSNGNRTKVTYADGSSTQYSYNNFAEVTQQADSGGETTSYGYNGTGDLTSFTDATGATTTYVWANGLMTSETDPGQNGPETSTFSYDAYRRQVESIDALGAPFFTSYDTAGNVAATWDALGEETQTTTDGNNQLIKTIAANGAITSETYNAYGEVTSSTDGRGLTSTTTYDQRGWDIKDTDPTGASTQSVFNADGDVTQTIDPDQHATNFSYDADNRQIGETDPLGYSSTTTYDADSEVLSTVDPMGRTNSYVYNVMGEQVLSTDPMGRTVADVYDSEGNVVASLDARGWTLNQYDADNRQISTTNPGGETTRTVYDAVGDVAATIDALGFATKYTFDADNRQIKVTDANGHSTETVYNAIGEAIGSIDARGYETFYYYDTVGDQIGVLDPTGDLSQTVYDADGNAIATIDPRGGTTIDVYDADNRLIGEKNADGFSSSLGYDPAGNETISIDDNGKATLTYFDADNRATRTVDPNGHEQQTVYDPDSEVIATINGDGHGSFTAYDADGEQVSQRDADGNVTQTPMNTGGEQADEVDPDGNAWTYFYDASGNQIGSFTTSADDAQGSYAQSVFDADNRLISGTDADGRKITYSYDSVGNLLTETWFNASGQVTDTQTYTYDSANNVLTAANSQGQYTYTYDQDGRVSTATDPWGLTLTYGYDKNGNVVSVQDSLGGVLTSTYDAANQLTSRQFSGTGQTPMRLDLTYTPDGQMATETYYSNLAGTQVIGVATYGYDAVGNLISLVDTNGSNTVIASYSYVYDPANLLTSETDTGTVTNYSYDAAGQLLSAGSQTQSYDANGNRTDTGYQTGAGNELLSDGTWNYTYDNNGSLIQKTGISNGLTWTYSYDDANRLISATQQNSSGVITSETLKYDVYGNLVEQNVFTVSTGLTVTTRYAIDQNGNAWADLNSSNVLQMRRLYLDGPNQVYARIDSGGTLAVYFTDHLGSVRDIVNASGNVIDAKTYDAWGNLVSESNPSEGDRESWAGLVFDATTGLYETTHRDYDPMTGRWLEVDPTYFKAGSSNLYEYVGNGPTVAVDPSGEAETEVKGGKPAKLDNPTFSFDEGGVKGTGTISVIKDISVKGPTEDKFSDGFIELSVKTDFKMDSDWQWIQVFKFDKFYNNELANSFEGQASVYPTRIITATDKRVITKSGNNWHLMGETYLDNPRYPDPNNPNLIYYSARNYYTIRRPDRLSIFDSPKDRFNDESSEKWKIRFTGDAYLVHKGKFYYHINWTREGSREKIEQKLTPWKWTYGEVKGEPSSEIPAWAKNAKLLGGYAKISDEGKVSEPFEYPNPFFKK